MFHHHQAAALEAGKSAAAAALLERINHFNTHREKLFRMKQTIFQVRKKAPKVLHTPHLT